MDKDHQAPPQSSNVHLIWRSFMLAHVSTIVIAFYVAQAVDIGLQPEWANYLFALGAASTLLCIPFAKKYASLLEDNPKIRRGSEIERLIHKKMAIGGLLLAEVPALFSLVYYITSKEIIGAAVLWAAALTITALFRPRVAYEG